jgi:hypothetical protein
MISSVHLTNHESGLVACPIAIEVVTRYCPGDCGVESEASVFQYPRRALKSNVNTTGRFQQPTLARTQRAYRGPTFDLYGRSLRIEGAPTDHHLARMRLVNATTTSSITHVHPILDHIAAGSIHACAAYRTHLSIPRYSLLSASRASISAAGFSVFIPTDSSPPKATQLQLFLVPQLKRYTRTQNTLDESPIQHNNCQARYLDGVYFVAQTSNPWYRWTKQAPPDIKAQLNLYSISLTAEAPFPPLQGIGWKS